MKYRILFANKRWSVVEPSGEAVWFFDTRREACDWIARRCA